MSDATLPYRGRFAPSPTGPLHLGSLIAALASYLDAKHNCGTWLVRMENLDPPREESGADQRILHSLEQHGLHWDEDIMWQGQRDNAYDLALAELELSGQLFRCDCTRAMLGAGGACDGRCQARQQQLTQPTSSRIAVPAQHQISFEDRLQGPVHTDLGRLLPDFVVKRKDGLIAYQLAVVVDDACQGVTHIVRGSDLLDSTERQIYLQQLLGFTAPRYYHLPVITDTSGHKLSKQNQAPALDDSQASGNLRAALNFLRQAPPPIDIHDAPSLLRFATEHWQAQAVPNTMAMTADGRMP